MATIKLFHKLIVLVIIPIILSIVVFGGTSYFIFKEKLIEARTVEAKSVVTLASEVIRDPLYFLELDELNEIIRNIKENPNVESVYIMKPDGRVIADGTRENKFYNQSLEDDFSQKSITSNGLLVEIKKDVLHISTPVIITEKIGIIRSDFSLKEINVVIKNSIITLSVIGVIIAVVVMGIGFYISSSISRPIKKLTNTVEDISRGKLDVEIDQKLKESKDEVGALARAFDRIIVSLKLAMKKDKKSIK